MATLEKRIESLEQQHNSQDASSVLLRHLGVLYGPMPSKVQGNEIKPQPLDDRLIVSLIAGAESAMKGSTKLPRYLSKIAILDKEGQSF